MKTDIHAPGVTRVSEGEYGDVHVSGSFRADGDISCEQFHCSGAGTINGSLQCSGEAHCSGALRIGGDAAVTGRLRCSGAVRISGSTRVGSAALSGAVHTEGDFRCDEDFSASGGLKTGGSFKGTRVNVSGVFNVGRDVECESFRSSAAVTIPGLLNAEEIDLTVGNPCRIDSIGCASIKVRPGNPGHMGAMFLEALKSIFSRSDIRPGAPALESVLIEGDDIDLECTRAATVRGANVRLGPGCVVDRVEYSGTLVVDENAQVGARKYTGA